MSLDDFYTIMANMTFPVFDGVSEAGTPCTYGVVMLDYSRNSAADDITYSVNVDGTLELYTLGKDYKAMAEVENTFNRNKIPWQHTTSYDAGQNVFIEYYSFGFVAGGVEPEPTPEPTPTPDPEPEPVPEEEPEEEPEG